MLSRSFWMAVWLMVSLKTQTLGPKAATFAPGQIDASAPAAWDGAAANPAAAASAATTMAGRRSRLAVKPLVILFISVTFAPQTLLRASPQGVLRLAGHSLAMRHATVSKASPDADQGHPGGKRRPSFRELGGVRTRLRGRFPLRYPGNDIGS